MSRSDQAGGVRTKKARTDERPSTVPALIPESLEQHVRVEVFLAPATVERSEPPDIELVHDFVRRILETTVLPIVGLSHADTISDIRILAPADMSLFRDFHARRAEPRPAAFRAREELPDLTVSRDYLASDPTSDCAVCLEVYTEGQLLKVMPCSHRFHRNCLFPWLRAHNTCPVCRFQLPAEPVSPPVGAAGG